MRATQGAMAAVSALALAPVIGTTTTCSVVNGGLEGAALLTCGFAGPLRTATVFSTGATTRTDGSRLSVAVVLLVPEGVVEPSILATVLRMGATVRTDVPNELLTAVAPALERLAELSNLPTLLREGTTRVGRGEGCVLEGIALLDAGATVLVSGVAIALPGRTLGPA